LDVETAADVIQDLPIEEQLEILVNLEPDDASSIFLEIDEEERQAIREALDDKSDVIKLASYDEDLTGSKMTTNILKMAEKLGVKEAFKNLVKRAPDVESISTIYIVSSENSLLGAISLKKLILAKEPLTLKDILEEYPFVYDDDDLSVTAKAIKNYDMQEMPVVDKSGHLLGVVTMDDAIDAYTDEAIEDYQKIAALPEDSQEKQNIFYKSIHRLPWLVILLLLSFPISLVTSAYEDILSKITLLMIFTPLILDASGDVATQTLAVTLKSLSTKEKGLGKQTFREISTGFVNGLIMGIIAFAASLIFSWINPSMTENAILISTVVGLSLWATVFAGPIIGFGIPYLLKLLKVDAAVASGPFITSLIDIIALFIYLGLATLLLGGVV
jgi:magnesium transporter